MADKSRESKESKRLLNPKFPVVEGKYQMTKEWSITLPGQFNRRFEEGSLVIWRPGITAWIIIWNNDKKESSRKRQKDIRDNIDSEAFAVEEHQDGPILRFAYRLTEKRPDGQVHAFYAFSFSDDGHVQMAVYLDAEADLQLAKAMWRTLKE